MNISKEKKHATQNAIPFTSAILYAYIINILK